MRIFNPINMFYSASEFMQDSAQDQRMVFLVRANRFLVPAVVLLGAASLCYLMFYSDRQVSNYEKEFKAASEVSGQLSVAEILPNMPVAQIRNLFEPVGSAEGAVNIDVVSKFRVAGIILDGSPQAVLQDRQENRSVFVHKGDHVAGFVVKDIREGKVVLSSQDQEWELMP